ncbi:Gldg family protein [uncultured Desulfobacter sp.]|uniref:GldG family protein n=1 Tax=uncultured Desulfobacter sp. TaxID=240139 RepID=UPI0029C747C9|nr:Gldg family protein [uncultured Desulfobacter sp.]
MGKPFLKEYYLKFILYVVVIVLLNVAGLTLFFRFDLTANRIYSLSDASKQAVSTLSEPLNIKVFFSKNLPAPHNNTERYLRDLLTEYAAQAGRYFNFTFYNVSQETDMGDKANRNREMARDYGISPVQIRVMENDELKFKNAYMGLVILHGDLIEKIPAIIATDGLEYQLTGAIRKLNNKVSALLRQTDKINITMYMSSGLNAIAPLIGLDALPYLGDNVAEAVKKLNNKNLGIFQFERKDLSDPDELEKVAEKYDLMAMQWPDVPEENIQAGSGTAGLVVEYKGKTRTLPLITAVEIPIIGTTYQMADPQGLGEQITAIMEKLIGINKDIGYLSDHGSPTLGPDRMAMMQGRAGNGLTIFEQLVGSRYNIKQIPLKDEGIPEGLNCLVIAKPTQHFSDYELFQIDQALMKGTNIAVFADAFEQQQGRGGMMGMPAFAPIDTGLEKLLAHYGVEIQKAYVLDKNAYKQQMPQSQGGGEQTIYFAPVLKDAAINNEPVFMKNIKGLVAMQISPVKRVKGGQDESMVSAVRLLSSSNQAWLMEDNINLNPMFLSPPPTDNDLSSYDLAYLLEGQFTSYFKGKPVPKKEAGESDVKDEDNVEGPQPAEAPAKSIEGLEAGNRVIETSAPAKIFVLGCAQMLHDNMLDEEGRSPNATFLLNAIDHLNGDDGTALLRSKQQTLNPISDTNPLAKNIIKGFNVIGLSVLVFLFGLAVWFFRSMKKKRIAQMFG